MRRRVEGLADAVVPRRLHAHKEKVLYLAVGGWNTLFGYAAFAVLYALLGGVTSYAVIIVASYVVAIANAYAGYRYVVFRSHGKMFHELPRFAFVYLVTMVVNLVFFPLALKVLPVSGYLVQAVFTIGVVIVSYLGHKHFSFRKGQGNSGRRQTCNQEPGPGGG